MLDVRRALLMTIAVAGCTGQEVPARSSPEPAPTPSFVPAEVAPPARCEGTTAKVTARSEIALDGPRVDGKPGDHLLTSAGSVAVIASDGRLVDFGARGGRDDLSAIDSTVFFGFEGVHFEIDRVEPACEGRAIHVVRRVLEKPLALHVFYTFSGDRLRIESALVATAPLAAPLAVTLGERVYWGNTPTWAEGMGFVTRGGSLSTDHLARESYGLAYALRAESGRIHARFDNMDSGFFEPATNGETPELVPPDRPTSRRVVMLAHAPGSLGRAVSALLDAPAQKVAPPAGLPPEARVEIGRCATGTRAGSFFARYLPGDEIALPAGCFQMRLVAPGHQASPWFSTSAAVGRALPPSGTLRFTVRDKTSGRPLPARVLVRGIKGTGDPDWGTDADRGAALNVVYADASGEGARPAPPGKYHVTVDRGFEYTLFEKDVEIVAGKTAEVAAEIDRVVDTRGYVAADLHLHAMPSADAPQPLADRVRALAATGVEVGVATDHNKVTDYGPVIDELRLGAWVTSIVGDEITTREPAWGHFNVFPLPPGIDPLPFRGQTPTQLFAAARAAGPKDRDTVLQLNHPRMGSIGYFELLRFDRDDVAGWKRRVAVADLGFDAIEVFNGDHYARIDKVEECLRDWYALLDAGHRFTATGNSDSHRLSFHEAGVPRNLVAVPSDDPAKLDEKAFIEAVRKGRLSVSSGPFIKLEAGGKGMGETIAAGERVEVSVVVESPPWVEVDKVELVGRGGEVLMSWGPFDEAKGAPRPAPKAPEGARRLSLRTQRALAKGSYLIAIARGSRPMTHLHRAGARPFAFTNPIWVE